MEDNPALTLEVLVIIVFLGKPDGGLRPIGLTESVLKVWSKLRHQLSKDWESQHDIPAFWGMAGRSADRAGWFHNMMAAYANSNGWDAGTLGTDLKTFYETVDHDILMSEAEATGYPLKLMRALLVLYGGPRAISFEGQ